MKLLVLVPVDTHDDTHDDTAGPGGPDGDPQRQYVAVDYTGAGHGEVVLVTRGTAARVDEQTTHIPTDAAVVAIVDSVVLDHKMTFRKGG